MPDYLRSTRGPKPTFRAAATAPFAAAAGTAPFFVFEGSATKTIEVQRIVVSGLSLTAVAYLQLDVRKHSAVATGDAGTALVQTPNDTGTAAPSANRCTVHTTAPVAGTLVGTIAARRVLGQATVAVAAGVTDEIVFDFRTQGMNVGIFLRGVAQGITLAFAAAPATVVTLSVEIEWCEESN